MWDHQECLLFGKPNNSLAYGLTNMLSAEYRDHLAVYFEY